MSGKEVPIPLDFCERFANVRNFQELSSATVEWMQEKKKGGVERIGFVSGMVASQGPQNVKDNMQRLLDESTLLTKELNFPVFSSTEIFTSGVWERLPETQLPKAERSPHMHQLFRDILAGGVTDIFMMPDWQQSGGATDENNAAKELGLKIHYLPQRQRG